MASCITNMKSKAYLIRRPYAAQPIIKRYFERIERDFENFGIEVSCETVFLRIARELANDDYHGYASLIFVMEPKSYHRKRPDADMDRELDILYRAIEDNPTLKYVTKLVINMWNENMIFSDPDQSEIKYICGNRMGSYRNYNSCVTAVEKDDPICIETANPAIDNLIVFNIMRADWGRSWTDNYIEHNEKESDIFPILKSFLEQLYDLENKDPLQQLASIAIDVNNADPKWNYTELASIYTTTNAGCFLFNINPALAVIINHSSFFNAQQQHLNYRSGSQMDVVALKSAFRSKKIPCFIVDDGSSEDVEAIMEYLQNADLSSIKDFFIIIMSHGDEGDIIYTRTQIYSIRDNIVLPLLKNRSMVNTQKFIIVNACRGKFDPLPIYNNYKLKSEIQRIKENMRKSYLYPENNKMMLIFSTQQGWVSYHWPHDGSIFVQKFAKGFAVKFDEKAMEVICQETAEDIISALYGEYQIPDFATDAQQPHLIKADFANFFNYVKLLNNMCKFFKSHFKERFCEDGN